MEQSPANGRPSGPHGPSGNRPRGSAHDREYMHIPCQTPKRARIGKFAHESGRSAPALERFAPVGVGGWSDSPQGVERFAPPATPVWAALRDSLGLIGPQRPLPAPFTAGMAHGLERLRHVARALFRKLPHRRLGHGSGDHKPHPTPARLQLLAQDRERRP